MESHWVVGLGTVTQCLTIPVFVYFRHMGGSPNRKKIFRESSCYHCWGSLANERAGLQLDSPPGAMSFCRAHAHAPHRSLLARAALVGARPLATLMRAARGGRAVRRCSQQVRADSDAPSPARPLPATGLGAVPTGGLLLLQGVAGLWL